MTAPQQRGCGSLQRQSLGSRQLHPLLTSHPTDLVVYHSKPPSGSQEHQGSGYPPRSAAPREARNPPSIPVPLRSGLARSPAPSAAGYRLSSTGGSPPPHNRPLGRPGSGQFGHTPYGQGPNPGY